MPGESAACIPHAVTERERLRQVHDRLQPRLSCSGVVVRRAGVRGEYRVAWEYRVEQRRIEQSRSHACVWRCSCDRLWGCSAACAAAVSMHGRGCSAQRRPLRLCLAEKRISPRPQSRAPEVFMSV